MIKLFISLFVLQRGTLKTRLLLKATVLRLRGGIQWNPVITVTKGLKKIGRNDEVAVLTKASLQENVWTVLPGGQKKVTVLRRWP